MLMEFLFLLLLAVTIICFIFIIILFRKASLLQHELAELSFLKSSQSAKYGRLTEQWIPFTQQFPYNPENFRFIGSPIDGIVFDENEIAFCEFKAASSQLSQKQKQIKQLVENGRVKWLEFRLGA